MISRLATIYRRFIASTRGVAAIEFAMIMPVLTVIFLGSYDGGRAIAVYMKVRSATYTLDAITNQYTTIHSRGDLRGAYTVFKYARCRCHFANRDKDRWQGYGQLELRAQWHSSCAGIYGDHSSGPCCVRQHVRHVSVLPNLWPGELYVYAAVRFFWERRNHSCG
jgi:Flp pilus assembly pilin Flp